MEDAIYEASMRTSDFRAPAAGRIHRSMNGIDTFVPSTLPPTITYDERLVLVLSRADTALSELSGIGRQLPNPHLLINPYLRREAILSSRIEGTRTSLSDLLLDEIDAVRERTPEDEADLREVRNYITALEFGIAELAAGRPLTLKLVTALHARLMFQVRGHSSSPGRFRTIQNWIGPRNSTVDKAIYVPPPPDLLLECLTDWERFLHVQGEMPDLIRCAILHEQFEAIHPFIDGNGRIGRLLITLFLIERDRLSQPLLYLSAYIEAHRLDYYHLLQQVRTDGDWNSWMLFFLRGIEETAREAVQQTKRLVDLREAFRSHLLNKPKALALIDHLFVNPYITVARAQKILEVSDPTARSAVSTLEASGVVVQLTGGRWRRTYVCHQILDAISLGESSQE